MIFKCKAWFFQFNVFIKSLEKSRQRYGFVFSDGIMEPNVPQPTDQGLPRLYKATLLSLELILVEILQNITQQLARSLWLWGGMWDPLNIMLIANYWMNSLQKLWKSGWIQKRVHYTRSLLLSPKSWRRPWVGESELSMAQLENIICSALELHHSIAVGDRVKMIWCTIVFLVQIRKLEPEISLDYDFHEGFRVLKIKV